MSILNSILPIIMALIGGYIVGRILPISVRSFLVKLTIPLVWALLFLIGSEFGEVISSAGSVVQVLKGAALFAVFTTLVPCLLIFAAGTRGERKTQQARQGFSLRLVWPPLKECAIALLMVALGSGFFLLNHDLFADALTLPSSSTFLLVLIFLVGIDLTQIRLDARWFSLAVLSVPMLVVIGSLLGAVLASWATGESLAVSMALSSGFGWFTLSSVMIGDHLGQTYGTMALMTDLMRELLAIMLLYAIGVFHPKVSIGSAGATALDSTLPIIKQACQPEAVPLALVSGFILTILAPIFISAFLS